MSKGWQMMYTGLYKDGAKIKTSVADNCDQVELCFRREYGAKQESFVMNSNQATETAYALLKAVHELNDRDTNEED